MKKIKLDGMLLATFITTLFYSATYPYIHKEIVSEVSDSTIALNQIINCISIVVFSTLWNKKSSSLFQFYPVFCVAETVLGISSTILATVTHNVLVYYIVDTLIFAIVTRNICCGGVKLRAMRYKTEKEREQYDNNDNSVCAIATIIGSLIAMLLKLNFIPMLWIATLGNAVDNMFYIAIYRKQLKERVKKGVSFMKHYTTSYTLVKGDTELTFDSEREACEYLGVSYCTIASCFRCNCKCKGYTVKRNGITTHGATKTRLFKIWSCMHERCERPKHKHFNDYGGRGIKVCDDWKEFAPFQQWALHNGYSDTMTIDRIDVNKNYSPDNCRWTTMKEQAKNKRTNHFVTVNGQKMTLSECSERYSIPQSTLRWREINHRDLVSGAKMEEYKSDIT